VVSVLCAVRGLVSRQRHDSVTTVSSGLVPSWEGNSGRKAWQVVHQGISQRRGPEAGMLTGGLDAWNPRGAGRGRRRQNTCVDVAS
jgi:hypothetical protein